VRSAASPAQPAAPAVAQAAAPAVTQAATPAAAQPSAAAAAPTAAQPAAVLAAPPKTAAGEPQRPATSSRFASPPEAAPRSPFARPVAPVAAANGARPTVADENNLSTARLREIYRDYLDAKRRCNESTSTITFDKIATNLRSSAAQLMNKHQGRKVDFEVVLKNGTPVLRPVIKNRP
jgi:hypothetical protein